MNWSDPIISIKGINQILSKKFEKLGVFSLGDLLLHFPFRYEDHTRLMPIRHLKADQSALIEGKIISVEKAGRKKKRIVLKLADQSAICEVVFFHFFSNQLQQWKVGNTLRCFGQVKEGRQFFQMAHPDWKVIPEDTEVPLPSHFTPIYPTVTGLTQLRIRLCVQAALEKLQNSISQSEHFAELIPLKEALTLIHRPSTEVDPIRLAAREHPAYQRLIIEELLSHYFSLKKIKEENKTAVVEKLLIKESNVNQFLSQLPFELTADQKSVWKVIREDLSKNTPMLRLLQGDVGCGKTVVSALAAWTAVCSGKQVALMVPTEILAEQHFEHFKAWFTPLQVDCVLLTGKMKAKEKHHVEEKIASHQAQIIIGTHALFQASVSYADLGLIIIDEQHRFGVHQRLALREKGVPHQLIMTATPIPRTLAMSQYAHLDLSTIRSLPPGRQPIKTLVIPKTRKEEVIEKIATICQAGQQVYWVCTLITESEQLECQAAEANYESLKKQLPLCKIGLVHGKLDPLLKAQVMQDFHQGDIQVLVATTVIEVGVNVPNAALMIIEDPERLGLAQLHQLRGRVGRGAAASFCVLLYQSPLSEMAKARLSAIRDSQDGFVIAEADLELRGSGELLGSKQTGIVEYKIVDLQRDKQIIETLPQWVKIAEAFTQSSLDTMIKRWIARSDYIRA